MEFVRGLVARMAGMDPLARARVEVLANSPRMRTRIGDELVRSLGPDALLPSVRLLTGMADHPAAPPLPEAVGVLRRQLRLSELVRALLEREEGLAPPAARFDLAASLGELLDELQGAGVDPAALGALDVGGHAQHWQTSLAFLDIVARHWPLMREEAEGGAPDPEARQVAAIAGLEALWAANPPRHPVIVAGSTGSRPATARLMRLVAGLPLGFVVLPGFDAFLPGEAWAGLAPDHPQAAAGSFLAGLGLDPLAVRPWVEGERRGERARLISLALRPAPVTDAWRAALPDLKREAAEATRGLTLIEAETRREEALAIALCLREGLERPGRVALVTPDRVLARQVTAALARWGIRPDDSAGRPLSLTPPGLFLRMLLRVPAGNIPSDQAVALLKHPLTGGAEEARRVHMLTLGRLERRLRGEKDAPPVPELTPDWFARWGATMDAQAARWGEWAAAALAPLHLPGETGIGVRVAALVSAAERLSRGIENDAPRVWERADGAAARELLAALAAEDAAGARLSGEDFARLVEGRMAAVNLPPSDPADRPDPRILILGNREARAERAGRVILGGLAEGVWPAAPLPDPWLSRPMRRALGLSAPERRIGLAAHDFTVAAGAEDVILTRSKRLDGQPALASRWLTRLTNLLAGAEAEGEAALSSMRARGAAWLTLARSLDRPAAPMPPEPRPAPRPALHLRPRRLSVTRIETLIRDPYAIHAEYILQLRPIDPLGRAADARDRGTVLHRVLRRFGAACLPGPLPPDARALFDAAAEAEIAPMPWAAERRLWRGRLARAAEWFLAGEAARRAGGAPVALEVRGQVEFDLPGGPFALTARADRIDRLQDGTLAIYDYKTGKPPSEKQERAFARQLWLQAVIARRGGFEGLAPAHASRLSYLGVTGGGAGGEERAHEAGPDAIVREGERFAEMMARWDDPSVPYSSRLRPAFLAEDGTYDHLARLGEWEGGEAEE